jgi:potassium-transporting ATPase KdpC subunit
MKTVITSLKIFLFFTILTGIIYPLLVTGITQTLFPGKANGSLIIKDDKVIGSKLVGQQFDSVIYFTSRPSAVSYNPLPSGGSNLGLTSAKLKNLVDERRASFIYLNLLDSLAIVPPEMLFASASGLDPHISPEGALMQAERIAKSRNFDKTQTQNLIQLIINHIESPQFSILGEERVNVLILNLELNKLDMNITNKTNKL